jgi:cell division protein FtsL
MGVVMVSKLITLLFLSIPLTALIGTVYLGYKQRTEPLNVNSLQSIIKCQNEAMATELGAQILKMYQLDKFMLTANDAELSSNFIKAQYNEAIEACSKLGGQDER